jgi:anthranilate synthase component 2
MARLILIDNYDSFTWNLVHLLGAHGAAVAVHRNDQISVDSVLNAAPDAIVLSPGPCRPQDAGICLDLIKAAGAKIPILGVCLGHQAIGEAYGGSIIRAPSPVHGKLASISHSAHGLFHGLDGPFLAARYHSLIVAKEGLPKDLEITAETQGLIMGLSHRTYPVHGVQFHPESIASENGARIFANFLELARQWNAKTGCFPLERV